MRTVHRITLTTVFAVLVLVGTSQHARAATTFISSVVSDANHTTLFIYGQNFCTTPQPVVWIFLPPAAAPSALPVTSFSSTRIVVAYPPGAEGIYLFAVQCSPLRSEWTFYFTVLDSEPPGTIGPAGPTGPTGPPGPQGPPGSNANVSVVAPLASTGGVSPMLSLPHVRIDTSGQNNTAVGFQTLVSNTYGSANTANGYQALASNTTGTYNTASGYQALTSTRSGSNNTAVGGQALASNNNGSGNTASGYQALTSNFSGSSNTANGYRALTSNTTGVQNTATGFWALTSNTTGGNNDAFGRSALHHNTTGSYNMAGGFAALYANTTGRSNAAVGNTALESNTTGNFNTGIGYNADVGTGDLTNATAIGSRAIVDASNKVRIGNTQVTVIEGQVPYTFTSDRNQKERFERVDGQAVLRKLLGLPLTSWNYIGQDPAKFRHYGPMAQDFFAAFGHDAIGTFGNDTTINSGDVAGITLIAVQTIARENEALTARLAAQEARVAELERLLKEVVQRNNTR